MSGIILHPVDKVEVLTVIDNTSDMLLGSTDKVKRPALVADSLAKEPLVAEHGYAALVTITAGDVTNRVLLDTGLSSDGLVKNLTTLEVDLNSIQAVVLSHGHTDHTKGLPKLIDLLPNDNIQLYTHPGAFLNRKLVLPDGIEVMLPPPDRSALLDKGVQIIEESSATTILDDELLITGEIPRLTEFEKGIPAHHAEIDGCWTQDCEIHDDQALVIHVKDKGLVILTGCGHAGIVNTVKYAQALTGVQEIYAILGGFHLSGPQYQQIIPTTVEALQAFNPAMIVPGHCTGWQAIAGIAEAMPGAFVPNSVGTRFVLA